MVGSLIYLTQDAFCCFLKESSNCKHELNTSMCSSLGLRKIMLKNEISVEFVNLKSTRQYFDIFYH